MAGDGTKYGTGDAEVDSRGVPIVVEAGRPLRQAVECAGCRQEISFYLSWAIITQDHAEFGLPCVAAFCAPKCMWEFLKRQEWPFND